MVLHILELCLCVLVLQIDSHPLSKIDNRQVKDIEFQDYDDNVKIDPNIDTDINKKHFILHPIIKKNTDTAKGIKIVVDPEMSVDEIKAALVKKKTEHDIEKTLTSLAKNTRSEQNGNILILNNENNTSNNTDKTLSKSALDDKNLTQTGNYTTAKLDKEPVYVLLKEGGISDLNELENSKVSKALNSPKEEMVIEDPCLTTTEICIDLSEHISHGQEHTTVSCKKTSIVCIDLLDESEKDLLTAVREPESTVTEVEKTTSKPRSEELSKLAAEDTTAASEAGFSETYKFHGEDIENSSSTAEIATIVKADLNKLEMQNSKYNNSLENVLNKQKIQNIFGANKNQNNNSEYYKSEGENSKQTDHKVMLFKPPIRVKSGKSEQNGHLQLQSQENNTLNDQMFKSIEKQYPNLILDEKKKIMTDNKKNKPIKEPIYVLLDNKELSSNVKEPDVCITTVVTTETTTEEVPEDPCLTTTACIDVLENISTSHESATAPCRKTSIICIDLLNESEKETPMAVGKSKNNTELEEVESTSLNESSEINVKELLKFTREPTPTLCLDDVTTEELVTICKEVYVKPKVQSSAVGDLPSNLQNVAKKQKISIDLDLLKNDNNNSDYLISKLGNNEGDESLRSVNGSIKFFINNSTDENTFLDENEELEISLP